MIGNTVFHSKDRASTGLNHVAGRRQRDDQRPLRRGTLADFQDNCQRIADDLRAFCGTLFGECLASCGSAGENPNPLLLIEWQTLPSVFSQTRAWLIPVDQK